VRHKPGRSPACGPAARRTGLRRRDSLRWARGISSRRPVRSQITGLRFGLCEWFTRLTTL
jgi:hypothetical protein